MDNLKWINKYQIQHTRNPYINRKGIDKVCLFLFMQIFLIFFNLKYKLKVQ